MKQIRIEQILDENRFKAYCPFHEDDSASLFIDLEKGAYCFAGCYKGDIVGLIAKLNGENRVIARTHINESFIYDTTKRYSSSQVVFQNHSIDFINALDWFQKKGFTLKTALYWKIEFGTTTFTVPVRDFYSNTIGIVTRNITGNGSKYVYNKGFKKTVLFGENFLDVTKEIIVVEGVLDVLWLFQNDFNGAGLFGTIVSDEQLEKLQNLNVRMAIFDDDVGGAVGAKNFKRMFPLTAVKNINIRNLTKDEIKEVLCQ